MEVSSTEFKFGFAKSFTSCKRAVQHRTWASFVCPLRCQLNRVRGHNNGVRLTKMLTAK